ncbi:MAG: type III secretion system export apparatus subunit SctS [Deltaproteobacteria bacterium]|nr:type III secretion system export apparatus subunit SctS [Deltaproteobacteria bacterium]MBI5499430.1 type III secretion system export apparatus subunit SctS [Deltaproteobacteria bacterium]
MVLQLARDALVLSLVLSLPVLAASLLVGLVVSFLQAVTQIQDHALSFVPKILAVSVALAVSGAWMGGEIVRLASRLFSHLP